MNIEIAQRAHAQKMFDQRFEQIGYLPPQILLDIARNESSPREWRKAAVELLLEGQHSQANHPDLVLFVREIELEQTAKNEVQSVVESATEEPFHAGVTTGNLQQEDVINNIVRNPDALGDDALGENDPPQRDKGIINRIFSR